MPAINLNDALAELDEARQTAEDIDNLIAFGTDGRGTVAKIVYEMELQLQEFYDNSRYDDDDMYREMTIAEQWDDDPCDVDFENPWVRVNNDPLRYED